MLPVLSLFGVGWGLGLASGLGCWLLANILDKQNSIDGQDLHANVILMKFSKLDCFRLDYLGDFDTKLLQVKTPSMVLPASDERIQRRPMRAKYM